MASILSLKPETLRYIILLTCDKDPKPTKFYLVNKRLALIYRQFQVHFNLYNQLERFLFSNWKIYDLNRRIKYSRKEVDPALYHQLEVWTKRNEMLRRRTKLETHLVKFEELFGGHATYKKIPTLIPKCTNLMLEPIAPEEFTKPVMKGFDGAGHRFVSLQVPTGKDKNDPVVTYLFIFISYWTLHHWSGERKLLGKTGAYISCLIEPYGFNRATYDFCRDLFTRILENKNTFRIRDSL